MTRFNKLIRCKFFTIRHKKKFSHLLAPLLAINISYAVVAPVQKETINQQVTLALDTGLKAIQQEKEQMLATEIKQTKKLHRWDWINYLPTIHYSFNKGIGISYNFMHLYAIGKAKEKNQHKYLKLKQYHEKQARKRYKAYCTQWLEKTMLAMEIAKEEEIMALETSIHAVEIEKHKKNPYLPTEWTKKIIAFKKKEVALEKLKCKLAVIQQSMQATYGIQHNKETCAPPTIY